LESRISQPSFWERTHLPGRFTAISVATVTSPEEALNCSIPLYGQLPATVSINAAFGILGRWHISLSTGFAITCIFLWAGIVQAKTHLLQFTYYHDAGRIVAWRKLGFRHLGDDSRFCLGVEKWLELHRGHRLAEGERGRPWVNSNYGESASSSFTLSVLHGYFSEHIL